MRAFPNIRTPAIAIATILAMLLVPACGSLCAAMNHCSTAAVNSNSDACHHGDISAAASDYISLSISSPASCGDQAPVLAVLTSSDEFSQLKSGSQSIVPFAIDSPNRTSALVSPLHESYPPMNRRKRDKLFRSKPSPFFVFDFASTILKVRPVITIATTRASASQR